eukprot:TRINITY_DN4583_c1_g1_i1.p1 TRINITY_DN4583_c1_g1~~TRINITY_DN4583_c1_g1_i1.p1  ORF type:complete len:177 (-),score=19.44 TRINITY_DN4583_c1_g1_i1:393-923(-)
MVLNMLALGRRSVLDRSQHSRDSTIPQLFVLDESDVVITAQQKKAFVIAGIRDACDYYTSLIYWRVKREAKHGHNVSGAVSDLEYFHKHLRSSGGVLSGRMQRTTAGGLRVDCWVRISELETDLRRCVEAFDVQSGAKAISAYFGLEEVANGKQNQAKRKGFLHKECSFYFEGPGT